MFPALSRTLALIALLSLGLLPVTPAAFADAPV